jgi:hypothetical protein
MSDDDLLRALNEALALTIERAAKAERERDDLRAKVEALADRLWAETEEIADPQNAVRLTYRHLIAQFRAVLEGGR